MHSIAIFAEKIFYVATKGKKDITDTWRLLNTSIHYPSSTTFTGCNISRIDGKLKFPKLANVALLASALSAVPHSNATEETVFSVVMKNKNKIKNFKYSDY